jgi:3-methyladenine DNA glycosylase/8-oxoguanine DNA glycosylase
VTTRPDGETLLRFCWPIDLALTVASHGWAHLAPWQWDVQTGCLIRRERIGAALGMIAARQHDLDRLVVSCVGFADTETDAILRRVGRWVSADWDPAPAVAALRGDLPVEAALIERGGGRLLRGSSFYEDFVKTVLTINTSWSATCRMAAALVAEPGDSAFPTPQDVLDYGEMRLRERARLGFRAATIVGATRRMLEDGAIDAEGDGTVERLDHDYLLGLKGIGPYAAAHCRQLLHDFSRLPVDTVVAAFARERYGHDPAQFVASRAGCGAYLALGYRLTRLRDKLAATQCE